MNLNDAPERQSSRKSAKGKRRTVLPRFVRFGRSDQPKAESSSKASPSPSTVVTEPEELTDQWFEELIADLEMATAIVHHDVASSPSNA